MSKQQEQVKLLDSAFEKVDPLDVDIMVYRGTDSRFFESVDVGDEIEDRGFVSTTAEPGVTAYFMNKYAEAVFLRIRVPQGEKVLAVEFFKGKEPIAGEYAVLLNRGTRFKVVNKAMSWDNRELILELEVVQRSEQ